MISQSLVEQIERHGMQADAIVALIASALAEDVAEGDKTSISVIPEEQTSTATLRARKPGVVAGVCIAAATFELTGITNHTHQKWSGDQVKSDDAILIVEGNTRNILLAERVALNFISHLSGVATLTRAWVDAVAGTGVTIRDTRKTTPGFRQLEKFAVRMGGGMNHRMNLSDGAIIKDNHIAAAGSIKGAVAAVRSQFPDLEIEVEVDNLRQLAEVVELDVDVILLDNMSLEMTREAVKIATSSRAKLESSGGITLASARAYAESGINYLAIGALTHSAPVLDIGLDF